MTGMLSYIVPGVLEIIIVAVIFLLPLALIIWGITVLVKNKRENVRLRLEVGKLADELEQVRKKKTANQ